MKTQNMIDQWLLNADEDDKGVNNGTQFAQILDQGQDK